MAVNITANTSKLVSGLTSAQSSLSSFVTKASAGAAAVTASFGGMLKMFESTGSALHDLSMASGISVDNLSFLKYAAEQSGTSLDVITKAARELLSRGIDPNKFTQIATSIAAITDPTMRAQSAFENFGKKAGFALLPMLQDLPALQQRFNELGGTFTNKMASAADALGDSFGNLKLSLQSVANTIAVKLAPTVTQITEYIADNVAGVRLWVESHEGLVKAVALVAASLAVVAPTLYAINTAVNVLTTSLKGLALITLLLERHPLILGLTAAGIAGYGTYKYFQGSGEQAQNGASGSWPAKPAAAQAAAGGGGASLAIQQLQLRELRAIRRASEDDDGDRVELGTAGIR